MYTIEKQLLENLFIKEKLTIQQIANKLGYPKITIQRHLRKNNLNRKLIKPSKELIIKLISEGKSQVDIAKDFGLSKSLINHTLRKKTPDFKSINAINEDNISESKPIFWYLVGLISSDGHISFVDNSVCIYQNNNDYLTKLSKYLGRNNKLLTTSYGNQGKKMYKLTIYSEKLNRFLIKEGLESDKRYSCPFIERCPKYLLKYYVRGFLDGDGCIYYRLVSGTLQCNEIKITSGSDLVVNSLFKLLSNFKPKITITNSKTEKICKNFIIRERKSIVEFIDWVYSGELLEVCLRRKYKTALILKELFNLQEKVDKILKIKNL